MGQRGWWTPRSLACSSFSQGKERRGRSRRKHRLCCPSACLLARLPAEKLDSQFGGICAFSPALGQEPFLLIHGPLAVPGSEQTPGRKVALSLWPGSPHGVRCVSLLHYTLPASAGGANSPGTPGLAGLNGAVRCLKLCSMSVLALFFSLGLMLSNTHAHSHNIVPILPPPPKLSH